MAWTRALSPREIAIAAGLFRDHLGGFGEWRSGHREGEYATADHDNFVWNTTDDSLRVSLPNRAQQTDQPYAYQFTDRQGGNFHFSFETTVNTPGFEAPFRFGLKQNPAANWGSDQGLSATFAFRSSGFRLELFARDGQNATHTHEWASGFRLDSPSRWVRGDFHYDSVAHTLAFTLRESESGDLLAEHTFTNVRPFAANMDRFVVSARGDPAPQSGLADTVVGTLRNVRLSPVALGPLLDLGGSAEAPWRAWARGTWGASADTLAPGDDPGGHGIPLVLRYALALDAESPDRTRLPAVQRHTDPDNGDEYLVLHYQRRTGANGVTLTLEGGNTLDDFQPIPNPVLLDHTVTGDTETLTLRDQHPLRTHPTRMLRLKVEVEE